MFDEKALDVMKRMMNSFGPPGFESETARIIREYTEPYANEIVTDKLGTIAYVVKGKSNQPRILLTGHIDEVGFIISSIDEKTGFLTFNPLGGWWDQVLLGQRVIIRTNKGDVYGVIAAKPPHLLTEEELKKVVKKEDMYIDIGTTSKEETERTGVKIGDPAVPWSPLTLLHDGKVVLGKAFDDRIGAFVIIETLRRIKEGGIEHENVIYGAFTVQEEVGLRGAKTIAHVVEPQVAIVLEVDIAGDIPGVKPREAPAKISKGPALLTFDRSMIPNQPLKELVIEVARECQIPLQLSQTYGGATDAGRIHLDRAGCPTVVLGIPTRHIHSHSGILSLQDVENAVRLLVELIKRLDNLTVGNLTSI